MRHGRGGEGRIRKQPFLTGVVPLVAVVSGADRTTEKRRM